MSDSPQHVQEKVAAGRLLALAASSISGQLNSFSSWLLLGFGAIYSLVIANFASVKQLISAAALQDGLFLLLVAVALGVFQRWLASLVAASATVADKADEIGKQLAQEGVEVDFKRLFAEVEAGILYPSRWLVRRTFNKILAGDFAASGRVSAMLSQVQSLLVMAQGGFAVAAAAVTAAGFKV